MESEQRQELMDAFARESISIMNVRLTQQLEEEESKVDAASTEADDEVAREIRPINELVLSSCSNSSVAVATGIRSSAEVFEPLFNYKEVVEESPGKFLFVHSADQGKNYWAELRKNASG